MRYFCFTVTTAARVPEGKLEMDQTDEKLDLSQCDKEPIHIPGSIQPHGMLLAINLYSRVIQQVAGNAQTYLALCAEDLLGQPIESVIGADAAQRLALLEPKHTEPLYLGSLIIDNVPGRELDLTAHIRDEMMVLELESASEPKADAAQMAALVRRITMVWESTTGLAELLNAGSQEFRRFTGFDRVMIFKFLEDETGVVASEDKIDSIDSLLNHHYPASDIPKQARNLYIRNPIRVIPDVSYEPAPLVPAENPHTGQPLDMSDCSLRSVSPVHIQYLKNLNVAAAMSVSIIIDGALWGMASFQHTERRYVPYEVRENCKLLGRIFSQLILARLDDKKHMQALQLADVRDSLLGTLSRMQTAGHSFHHHIGSIQKLVPADGAAILIGAKLTQIGHTPNDDQTRDLIDWLGSASTPRTFATHSLVEHLKQAQAYASLASGVLAVMISSDKPFVFLWFRAEYIETINWAGNPHKAALPGLEPGQLTPRKSFEDWKQTVRYKATHWMDVEIESADKFGRALLEMRMQSTLQELNIQLQGMLSEKEKLLIKKDRLTEEASRGVQTLRERETELSAILENTSDGYISMTSDRIVTAWNRKAEEILLWSREEAIGKYVEDLIVPPAMAAEYRQLFQQFFDTGKSWLIGEPVEITSLRKDGVMIAVEIRISAINLSSSIIFTAFLQDITQRKLQEKKRLQDGQEDALTGLANRRAMYSFLQARLEAGPSIDLPLQLLYLDLDGFKPVNDTFGHSAGDRVLEEVAQRLKECMRGNDLVARIGGDEFVVVATGLNDKSLVEKLCQRLLDSLRKPISIDKHDVSVGCSIGIVSAPKDGLDLDALLRYADIALYEAKAAGRNTWMFYCTQMSSRLLVRRQLEADLKVALRQEEMRLEYQPRFDVQSGQLTGAEALVRWQHPVRGYLQPDIFISIAEEAGLIVPLSDWVLREACLDALGWTDDIFVSVNLSPIEFKRSDLVARVQSVLVETGISPARLELEVTESVMLDNTTDALAVMESLKALGVRLVMDDFGTGYSSLSYIHSYPFDGLKIDRSFIAALDGSASGRAIMEAIIGMGNAMGMIITAEGVETQEQLEILSQLQCHQAQGFYLGRPSPGLTQPSPDS